MSELDNSNIDSTIHGISPVSELNPTPELTQVSAPEPAQVSAPESSQVLAHERTLENNSSQVFIYDSEVVSDVVSNIVEQTFVDLVKKSLENEETKKQISISLMPEVISVINNIISLSPKTLTDIEKIATEIIKDSKIDSKDIPNLIILIQNIYQFIYSLKNAKFDTKKRAEITSNTLKYIIHLLVLERKIKIEEDNQESFFVQTDLLIDACIGLLSYSKTLQTKGCLKKLFG
jgi:hypothetical protein